MWKTYRWLEQEWKNDCCLESKQDVIGNSWQCAFAFSLLYVLHLMLLALFNLYDSLVIFVIVYFLTVDLDEQEELMKKTMGFSGFDSTKVCSAISAWSVSNSVNYELKSHSHLVGISMH